uniref:hypothetical protein n=1 Tax=Mycobacterium lepromatosis TaxID=480418 RepID=UPI000AE6E458
IRDRALTELSIDTSPFHHHHHHLQDDISSVRRGVMLGSFPLVMKLNCNTWLKTIQELNR